MIGPFGEDTLVAKVAYCFTDLVIVDQLGISKYPRLLVKILFDFFPMRQYLALKFFFTFQGCEGM